jgi:hypothetical protein
LTTLMSKAWVVLVLSLLDWVLTWAGLVNHWIEEWNPIMAYLFQWPSVALLIKMIPILVLMALLGKLQSFSWIGYALNGAIICYFLVLCLHVYWIFTIASSFQFYSFERVME